MSESSTLSMIENAENTFTEALFLIHTMHARCARTIIASLAQASKVLRTDSESGILAMKKFSCLTTSGLANARQRGSLLRITIIDSQQRAA
jgi:hypothetical protein